MRKRLGTFVKGGIQTLEKIIARAESQAHVPLPTNKYLLSTYYELGPNVGAQGQNLAAVKTYMSCLSWSLHSSQEGRQE